MKKNKTSIINLKHLVLSDNTDGHWTSKLLLNNRMYEVFKPFIFAL